MVVVYNYDGQFEGGELFVLGPGWDRMSDWEKGSATGFMSLYFLDLALFGDADDDGLSDHPDWDANF